MAFMLITIGESDICLSDKTDWLALDDTQKTNHISRASYYCVTHWTCGFDWKDEDINLDDDLKCAIADYAYHDLQGTLYPDSDTARARDIKVETLKAGSLDGSTEYFRPAGKYIHLESTDAVLKAYGCTRTGSGMVDLIRG